MDIKKEEKLSISEALLDKILQNLPELDKEELGVLEEFLSINFECLFAN